MKRNAFTLIELLVVIAIIAVLMGILMPALRKVREQARQRECAGRVRQLVLSSLMYADDYDTKLPRPTGQGNWLQDVMIPVVHHMLDTGMTREMFYCPTNHNQQIENDAFWEFTNASWNGARFTNYSASNFIVCGYQFIVQLAPNPQNTQRGVPPGSASSITAYPRDSNLDQKWLKDTQEDFPASRPLVTDSIFGNTQAGTKWGYVFQVRGGIFGGMSVSGKGQGLLDQSSHLKNEYEPLGGNVGYLDGHVTWYNFDPPMDGDTAVPRTQIGPNWFW